MKKRFVFIIILLFTFVFISIACASSTTRLAGVTRYDTSASIALNGWGKSDYAILVYGGNYPDALSSAPLAKKYDAPILLTNGDNLPEVTKKTLIKLQVKNVFIIGGTSVVPLSTEAELQSLNIRVIRLAGQDRYETAIKVAQLLPPPTEIIVVTGEDFTDALSVGPIAALKQVPIIIVPKNYMPDSVKAYISANNISKIYILGNSEIIDDSIYQLPGSERIIGADKYVRNINFNIKFDNLFRNKDICIASGEEFADVLTGAAYAAKKEIPIIFVNAYPPSFTRIYSADKLNSSNRINGNANVFGSITVVPDSVVASLYSLPYTNKPSAPINIVAAATSSSEITVRWDQISDADYYYVYLSKDGISFSPFPEYKCFPGSSFILNSIQANTTIYFKVTAVKNGIESDYSNVGYSTTPNKPSTPTNLIAAAISNSEITIQWNQASDADDYYVHFSNDGQTFSPIMNSDHSKIPYKWQPGYSFRFYGVKANTTLYFKITATKNGVESDYSSLVSATTYNNATDSAVDESQLIRKIDTTNKVVALTFDDGDYSNNLSRIVQILAENDALGTFFLTGSGVEAHPELIRNILAQGHTIGNHSYSHPLFTNLSTLQMKGQLDRLEVSMQRITGQSTKPFFRPPYGDYNPTVLKTVGDAGYSKTITWNIDPLDWKGISADEITKSVLQNISPGSIVLMHASSGAVNTPAALPNIISNLKASGYKMVTLPELLTYTAPTDSRSQNFVSVNP